MVMARSLALLLPLAGMGLAQLQLQPADPQYNLSAEQNPIAIDNGMQTDPISLANGDYVQWPAQDGITFPLPAGEAQDRLEPIATPDGELPGADVQLPVQFDAGPSNVDQGLPSSLSDILQPDAAVGGDIADYSAPADSSNDVPNDLTGFGEWPQDAQGADYTYPQAPYDENPQIGQDMGQNEQPDIQYGWVFPQPDVAEEEQFPIPFDMSQSMSAVSLTGSSASASPFQDYVFPTAFGDTVDESSSVIGAPLDSEIGADDGPDIGSLPGASPDQSALDLVYTAPVEGEMESTLVDGAGEDSATPDSDEYWSGWQTDEPTGQPLLPSAYEDDSQSLPTEVGLDDFQPSPTSGVPDSDIVVNEGFDAKLDSVLSDIKQLMTQVVSFLQVEFQNDNTTSLQTTATELKERAEMLQREPESSDDDDFLCDTVEFVNTVQQYSSGHTHNSGELKWKPPTVVVDFNPENFSGTWFKMFTSYITWRFHGSSENCTIYNVDWAPEKNMSLEVTTSSPGNQKRLATVSVGSQGGLQVQYTQSFNDVRCWAVNLWVLAAGPVVEKKYDWVILSDPFKTTVIVLARNPEFFDMAYKTDVLSLLKSMGMVRPLNQPVMVEQSNAECHDAHTLAKLKVAIAAERSAMQAAHEEDDDGKWKIMTGVLAGLMGLFALVASILGALLIRSRRQATTHARSSAPQLPLLLRHPPSKYQKSTCAYCMDPQCRDLECQNIRTDNGVGID